MIPTPTPEASGEPRERRQLVADMAAMIGNVASVLNESVHLNMEQSTKLAESALLVVERRAASLPPAQRRDVAALRTALEAAKHAMADVRSSLAGGNPSLRIRLDEEIAAAEAVLFAIPAALDAQGGDVAAKNTPSSNADVCARCGFARREHVSGYGEQLCPTMTFVPPPQEAPEAEDTIRDFGRTFGHAARAREPQGAPEASAEALEQIATETAERIGMGAFRSVAWEAEYLPTEAAVIILAAFQRACETGR